MAVLRYSYLKYLLTSKKAYAYALSGKDPTKQMIFGSCLHNYMLEEGNKIAVWKGQGTRATKAYKEFEEQNTDKYILLPDEYKQIKEMSDAVEEHKTAGILYKKVLKNRIEEKILWKHLDYDISSTIDGSCIAEIKGKKTICIIDLKTIGKKNKLEVDKYQWVIKDMHYDMQAYMYIQAYKQAHSPNKDIDFLFCWIFIPTKPPYDIILTSITPESSLYETGKEKFNQCIENLRKIDKGEMIETPYYNEYLNRID